MKLDQDVVILLRLFVMCCDVVVLWSRTPGILCSCLVCRGVYIACMKTQQRRALLHADKTVSPKKKGPDKTASAGLKVLYQMMLQSIELTKEIVAEFCASS